jgi:acetoacetyl-CoA synthetase
LEARHAVRFADYAALHAWSLSDLSEFWRGLWDYYRVGQRLGPDPVVTWQTVADAHWFPGATLNYAEVALRAADDHLALVCCAEDGSRREVTTGELRRAVAALRAGLLAQGVEVGDRVVGYLPNAFHAVVALLATASLGAIWSCCPPEFGERSVLDRFREIDPKVMLSVDGYNYGGKWHDRREAARAIRAELPSVTCLVWVAASDVQNLPGEVNFEDLGGADVPLTFTPVAFEHPLWILYSSGTTGRPKAIVHGHGGIVLEHLKMLSLHSDLGPGSRFFWFSTTGWMMWNYLVSGLLVGATVVLYDGNPTHPGMSNLWNLAAREGVTYFGVSAPFIMACRKAHVNLSHLDLSAVRAIGSTGAVLVPEGFEWIYSEFSDQVRLDSVSGGTDVCTAFLAGCPWLAVRSGELSCAALGAGVAAFDDAGTPVYGELGELVLTHPLPSMPVYFWRDADGSRIHEAYFARFPGVWHHGDWLRSYPDGAFVVFGRSDATLNRGGVRMGTSEFYRCVDAHPNVRDSLVVEVGDALSSQLLLFVVLRGGDLTRPFTAELRKLIRTELSPRHAPDLIVGVSDIPYTLSGKKLEVPIKRILSGMNAELSVNPGTLRNPDALREVIAAGRRALGAGGIPV